MSKKIEKTTNELMVENMNSILNNRERERSDYGPFNENIAKSARIATELCNKEITTEDMFKIMMALKLSRLSYGNKFDTFLDLNTYSSQLADYLNLKP